MISDANAVCITAPNQHQPKPQPLPLGATARCYGLTVEVITLTPSHALIRSGTRTSWQPRTAIILN